MMSSIEDEEEESGDEQNGSGTTENTEESKDKNRKDKKKKKKFSMDDLSMEYLSQLIVISPNTFIYQVWIFFISLLGTVSSLFYTWIAVVRDDLDSWDHHVDEGDHHGMGSV